MTQVFYQGKIFTYDELPSFPQKSKSKSKSKSKKKKDVVKSSVKSCIPSISNLNPMAPAFINAMDE